jgi:hypothetical protein
VSAEDELDREDDDRAPICPACGVTQNPVLVDGETAFVCLECGFEDGPGRAS